MIKSINGQNVTFNVVLQNRATFQKIINVSLKGRFGPCVDWVDALEFARKIADIQTQWEVEHPVEEREACQEYVSSGKWEAECFAASEMA
jgi:hypothetical protein